MSTELKNILDEAPETDAEDYKVEDVEIGAEEAETVEATPEAPAEAEEATEDKGEDKAEEPKAERKEETPTVPLARFNEVLSRLRAAEEAQRLRDQEANRPKAPDVFENQEAFNSYVEQRAADLARNEALNLSETLVRDSHGDETVDAALQALETSSPADQMRVKSAKSPWHELVRWHNERRTVQEIGTDPDAYRARVEAEVRAQLEAEMAAKQVRQKPAPAPSLASETSVGGRESGWSGPTDLTRIIG